MSFFAPPPFEPADSFSGAVSALWVFVVGWAVLLPFLVVAWRFVVYRGRALRADSAAKEAPRLERGPVLLCGRVETDDGQPAVRVEIEQSGREWSHKGNWSHRWTEQSRVVHARPFRLRLANDEAVLVAPDERVRLVSVLGTEKHEGTYRRRVARIAAGDKVWVSGVLEEQGARPGATTAYRAGPEALVVRGSAQDLLEIATGGLDAQFGHWQRYYRRAMIWLGLVCAVVHLGLFGHFYALFWAGKVVMANVVTTSAYVTTYKGHDTTHYVIHAGFMPEGGDVHGASGRDAGGPRDILGMAVKDEVDFGLYNEAKEGRLKQVPFIYVPLSPSIQAIGSSPDQSIGLGLFGAFLALVALLTLVVTRRHATPWYEQEKVSERGRGTLAEGAWREQVPGQPGLYVEGRAPPLRR